MKAYVASGGLILGSVLPTIVVMVLSKCIPTLVLGRGRLVVRNIGGVIPVHAVVVMVLGSVPAVV